MYSNKAVPKSLTTNPSQAHLKDANINRQGRFAHIDALRGAAVLLVVLNHVGLSFIPGTMGVTIFFTISGFVITNLVLRERAKTGGFSAGRFYFNRAAKLLPPLLLLIIIPTLVWAAFNTVHWGAVLAQVFFAFNWFQIADVNSAAMTLPGSGVTWSLGVEEQFYIGFALLWLAAVRLRRAREVLLAGSVVVILFSTVLRCFLEPNGIHFVRGTDARLDSIALGVIAAVLLSFYQEGRVAWLAAVGRDWVPFVALALLGASGVISGRASFLIFTLQSTATALVILYGLMPAPSKLRGSIYVSSTWKPVEVIGLASYSIYLGHFQVILLVQLLGLPSSATIALGILGGTLIGVVVWRWVEVPALARKKRFLASRA